MMSNLNDLDKLADQLVKDYQKAYLYILDTLEYQINRGLSENQSRSLLREIQLELKRLDEQAYKWSYDVLPEYYYTALSNIDKDAALLSGVNVIQGGLIVMHKKAIQVASKSLFDDLAKNTQYMSKQAKDIIRYHGKEIVGRQVITGESQRKTKKDLLKALKENGVTSFVDAGQKEWKIDKYTSMAVRTKSRIIHNTGTMNRLFEYQDKYNDNENFDLIQISRHGAADWCRHYEDMVFSISGNHPYYPSVDTLPNYPYQTFHPNCKHVWLSYMPELRGIGETVSKKYQNRTIKDLNKEDYHKRKAM